MFSVSRPFTMARLGLPLHGRVGRCGPPRYKRNPTGAFDYRSVKPNTERINEKRDRLGLSFI